MPSPEPGDQLPGTYGYRWLGTSFAWEFIGTLGSSFAVTESTIYGLTPDRTQVVRYDPTLHTWTPVGGAVYSITACP